MIVYKCDKVLPMEAVQGLYESEGWVAYTKDMPKLMQAIENSLMVLTAWDGDALVGLVRVVGDGFSILYIQDIIVLQEYRRHGIGSELVRRVLEAYPEVRQKVLLTDESPMTRGFYESLGFASCDKGEMVAFVRFG